VGFKCRDRLQLDLGMQDLGRFSLSGTRSYAQPRRHHYVKR